MASGLALFVLEPRRAGQAYWLVLRGEIRCIGPSKRKVSASGNDNICSEKYSE